MFRNLINVPFADKSLIISIKIVAMVPDSLVNRSTLYILRITLLIYTTISDRTRHKHESNKTEEKSSEPNLLSRSSTK